MQDSSFAPLAGRASDLVEHAFDESLVNTGFQQQDRISGDSFLQVAEAPGVMPPIIAFICKVQIKVTTRPTKRGGRQVVIALTHSTHDDGKGCSHAFSVTTHTRAVLPVGNEIFGHDTNAKDFGDPKIKVPIFAPLRSFLLDSCKVKADLFKSGRTE